MLRSTLIYLSKAAWARRIVTGMPLAWRAASRFVAGETLDDAVRVVKEIKVRGNHATLDFLGENTTSPEKAETATISILGIIDTIDAECIPSGVSIKLTQIGLALSPDLCEQNLARILTRANAKGIFVRLDMEEYPCVDPTLALYRKMRNGHGFQMVGVVIQAYLYRSVEDIRQLAEERAPVRLCKGAYKEPPQVAFPKKRDVDTNFDRLTEMLIEGALQAGAPLVSPEGKAPPLVAIATHDEARITHAKSFAREMALPMGAMEFQMLNGIRRDLQASLAAEGYPVRVYIPFGSEWYPYFMRRLAERPANLWFFVSNLFHR